MWCNYRSEKDIAGNTINLRFVDRRTVRPIEYSDTATPMKPAHISKKFNPLEPLGLWFQTTSGESNPEINFQMPKGALLEITYCWINSDESACGTTSGSSLSYPRVYSNKLHTDIACVGKTFEAVIAM